MQTVADLQNRLRGLDGKGYGAYKAVKGAYRGGSLVLHIDHVQGDPFATPSRFRAVLGPGDAGLPSWALSTPDRRRAAADFLTRRLGARFVEASGGPGSGKSGELRVLRPGQEVLERTALSVDAQGTVTARFRVGLPARGRRILGHAAADLVGQILPTAILSALVPGGETLDRLREHVETVEDAVALREQLLPRGLVAFVAQGARLPRRSGVDDRPLDEGVVPFVPPDSLRVSLDAPNVGSVEGLGIPAGITLIVGGGYHGKSTLLRALERGVYDHIPGDGREQVVSLPTAVKVRAEDGRSVAGTDISNFIGPLPGGGNPRRFVTENASGSTSQAAAVVEALEAGARILLLDEDTSATNFMIRDARMQRLVSAEDEPITPFIDRAGELAGRGISTILVVGGSGDYFDVADTVIAMREYVPSDVTERARDTAAALPTRRLAEGGAWSPPAPRRIREGSVDARRGRRAVYIRVRDRDRVEFGADTVELAGVEQIVESAQSRALAHAVAWGAQTIVDQRLMESLDTLMARIEEEGLGATHPHDGGELAAFRTLELAAFLNRLRTLETVEEDA